MKVILYLAISINGLIEDASGATPWSGKQWERWGLELKRAGCVVVGRNTHDLMSESGEYEKYGVRRVIVLTSRAIDPDPLIKTAASAQQALDELAAEGFSEIVIGGGSQTNAAFLEIGCVSEIYLDVEPFLFGGGLPLLSPLPALNLDLQLLDVDRYAPNALGLRYKVQGQGINKPDGISR
jgi:dihydrofolate reductase